MYKWPRKFIFYSFQSCANRSEQFFEVSCYSLHLYQNLYKRPEVIVRKNCFLLKTVDKMSVRDGFGNVRDGFGKSKIPTRKKHGRKMPVFGFF